MDRTVRSSGLAKDQLWTFYKDVQKERDGTWRIKTNDELDKLIRRKNIINYINHKG